MVGRDSDTLRTWISGTKKDVFGFNMPIICHDQAVSYLDFWIRFVRNVTVASKLCERNLCTFEDSNNGFNLLEDADAWLRELECNGWQQHHVRGPRFGAWHGSQMFSLSPAK